MKKKWLLCLGLAVGIPIGVVGGLIAAAVIDSLDGNHNH